MINVYSISMPVWAGTKRQDKVFNASGHILGTCFSLNNNIMLTAGHVLNALSSKDGAIGLNDPQNDTFAAAHIIEKENLPCDLGILKVEFVSEQHKKWVSHLKWAASPLNTFDKVRCMGFAYGLSLIDEKFPGIVIRGFEGHIVCPVKMYKPLGFDGSYFSIYELSFLAPRGLSGAPLLNSSGAYKIHGIVIGNSKNSMLVYDTKEVSKENGKETIVERYETLSLGIAVTAEQIFSIPSKILGSPIGDYLNENNLIDNGS